MTNARAVARAPACRLLQGVTVLVVDGDIGQRVRAGPAPRRAGHAGQVRRERPRRQSCGCERDPGYGGGPDGHDGAGYRRLPGHRGHPGHAGCEDLPIIALTARERRDNRGPGQLRSLGLRPHAGRRGRPARGHAPAAGPGVGPRAANMTPGRPRILLVDDIDDNLCALEAILRPLDLAWSSPAPARKP